MSNQSFLNNGKPPVADHARPEISRVIDGLFNRKLREHRKIDQEIGGHLLETINFKISCGKPSTRVSGVQNEVLGMIASRSHFQHLRSDPLFMRFAQNMCLIAARHMGWCKADLAGDPQKVETFVEYLDAHYSLMREAKLSPTVIKKWGHKFSLGQIDDIISDAQTFFGASPDSRPVRRTAVYHVLNQTYDSIVNAKKAYDAALKDARDIFGADPESQRFIRTAAVQVFAKKFSSVAEAKRVFDSAIVDARKLFGAGDTSDAFFGTVASLVLSGKYASAKDAKKAAFSGLTGPSRGAPETEGHWFKDT